MPMAAMTAEDTLDEFQLDKLHHLLPVIVIMAVVCVVGIVGNSFTVAFYGFIIKRTPTIFLITALACVDLVGCILIVPQIVEMAVNVKFNSVVACRLMHFFGHWALETSVLTLWIIAIDRYRHVCFPLKRQMSLDMVKRVVGIIIVLVLLISIRNLVNFDLIEFSIGNDKTNTTVDVHYCTNQIDAKYKISVTLFHSFDALVIVMVTVTLCFTYGRIVWTIRKGGLASTTNNKHAYINKSFEKNETQQTGSLKQPACIKSISDQSDANVHNDSKSRLNNISKIKGAERSITLMMLVVSLVFCICFVPYFVVKIAIRSYSSVGQLELGIGIQLAIRLVYVNSFANPVIFCCFNPKFRQYIIDKMRKR